MSLLTKAETTDVAEFECCHKLHPPKESNRGADEC